MMHNIYINQFDVPGVINGNQKQVLMRAGSYHVQPYDRLRLIVPGNSVHHPIRSTRCDESHYLFIDSNKTIIIDDCVLSKAGANDFARDMGFFDYADFFYNFKLEHRLPFEGQVVKWL